ncbi:MAG: Fur family transcriptional regulator [Kordiimonas sp.]|nr:Fur family transcriptional regulator [Kordiimonas sp.]|tara:strand:+ start:1995 stop:2483 length:489 start_codon:yes stop_codon:yes gene_type:complete
MPHHILKDHDHNQCISSALRSAEDICLQRGIKLTQIRRQVLEIIWQGHQPSTAYDILDCLSQQQNKKVAPPTVYRALDFLLDNGLIHRLESMNAYIGCDAPTTPHQSCFLICSHCRSVAELHDMPIYAALAEEVRQEGFKAKGIMIEVKGVCADCVEQGQSA